MTFLPGKWATPQTSDHSSVLQRLGSALLSASFLHTSARGIHLMSVTSILMQAISFQNSTARSEDKALVGCICVVEEDIVGSGRL